MSQPIRRNLIATITPASGQDLTLEMTALARITTASTGTIATLVGHGGTAPYSYSIASGALPTNTALDAVTGAITVTGALTQGAYTFVAQVDDSNANSFPHAFSIRIESRLSSNTRAPLDGEITVPYNYQFAVSGATGAVTWALGTGTLPSGLTLHSSGLLDGTPTAPAAFNYFSVVATDAGSTDTLEIFVRLIIHPELQMFVTPTLHYAVVGEEFVIDASIPTGNYSGSATGVGPWKYSAQAGSDAWITIDAAGIIRGTPPPSAISPTVTGTPVDTINFTYVVVDSLGVTVSNSILGGVIPAGQGPLQPQKNGTDVGPAGPRELNVEEGSNVTVTASNDGTRVTYRIDAAGGATYTDTGITFVGGSKAGVAIDPTLIGAECSSISTGEYDYPAGGTDWQLWVYPTPASGTFELDVRKKAFANSAPGSSDSICASAKPSLSGDGLTLTATGSLTTWTDSPLARGSQVTVVPTINTAGVKWWAFYMPARRSF